MVYHGIVILVAIAALFGSWNLMRERMTEPGD